MLNAQNNPRLDKIHQATIQLLRKTGVKFHHPQAVEILRSNDVLVENNIAYFTEDQLMHWVRKAPGEFEMYARDPRYNIVVGGDHVNLAPTFGAPLIVDQEGNKRAALLADYLNFAKLYEMNPAFKVNGGCIVQPDDIPPEHGPLIMFYLAYKHSDKCMLTNSGPAEQLEALMEMVQAAFGDADELAARPRVTTIVSVNSPLQFDYGMTETLFTFAKYGQPVNVDSGAMAGSTSPVTYAATVTLVNAEVLAGIALSQMIRPGTPVMYGSTASGIEMKNGAVAIGSPGAAICFKYCTLMAKYYQLPCRGGGALSDAKTVDLQAGYESMLTFKTCADNKMNFIIHAAGVLDGFGCASYEKLILDFEVIDFVNRVNNEFEINEETLALDIIDKVGHGGQYLTEPHTFKFCRQEPLRPNVSVRGHVNDSRGQVGANIKKRIQDLYDQYEKPARDKNILSAMKATMMKQGVESELVRRIDSL